MESFEMFTIASGRPSKQEYGLSLAEVMVVMGILAILLAIATPAYLRYRSHLAVDTADEMVHGLLARSREEARASGFALSSNLVETGVTEPAASGPHGTEARVSVRVRKRYRAAGPATVVTSRELSSAASIGVEVSGLGVLDLDADPTLEGVFFEIVVTTASAATVLATIPVDVNGEFVLLGREAEGTITLNHDDYAKTIGVTHRGVVAPGRR